MTVAFRDLPAIEKLVENPSLESWDTRLARPLRVRLARELVGEFREKMLDGESCPSHEGIAQLLEARYREIDALGMRRVVNATGVVLHTNLGRAPVGRKLLDRMAEELQGYCSLEMDLRRGERGSRSGNVERLVRLVTGAPAAVVVNNNAAAVFLALHAIARGKGALISRGELVQIGGGFRIPDILEASGTALVEVGTTNITTISDFDEKLFDGNGIGIVLKVHPGNFFLTGHVESPSIADLATSARRGGVPFVVDLGSGALVDEGLGEPTVSETLQAGAGLVCFSGDKLLGGPQAGIVVGERSLVDKMKRSPLYRALRPGKFELFLLEQVLLAKARGERSPTEMALTATPECLLERAEALAAELSGLNPAPRVVPGTSSVGGGATPAMKLPTSLVELSPEDPEGVARELMAGQPALVVRRENKKILIDPRTLMPGEDVLVVRLLREALGCSF